MSYDYSKQFLEYHNDLVSQLRLAARQGTTLEFRSKEPTEIRNVRYLVNNLLASLAFNYEGEEEIREVMRCWSVYDRYTGDWVLHIGPPNKKLTGRKPTGYRGHDIQLATTNVAVFVNPEPVIDQVSYERLIDKLGTAKDSWQRIESEASLMDGLLVENVTPIAADYGWDVSSKEPSTIIFTRKK